MKTALITGGGSGIGRALALALADQDMKVYIVGRTVEMLEAVQQQCPAQIMPIVADVSEAVGREKIVAAFKGVRLDYLVHNAAVIGPLKPLAVTTEAEWRQCFAVNVDGPLFLTQALLGSFNAGARVLHISSGLAHRVMPGLAAYSCSKAALYLTYQAFNAELAEQNILFGSVRPGVVNTGMQMQLRRDKTDFASQSVFKAFYEEGQLVDASVVGNALTAMLTSMSDQDFISKEWDVRADDFMAFLAKLK
jgi:benzil reductase ((S)-benzoin forming)